MSIRNGKTIPSGSIVTADVCVVGTGPAGVTAAYYLMNQGLKVTLIDGSREWQSLDQSWSDKTYLYAGEVGGFLQKEPEFPILPYTSFQEFPKERERYYGGTSLQWGGQSRPFAPISFEKRSSGIPGASGWPGWPIGLNDLWPYYDLAARLYHLPSTNFSASYWAGVINPPPFAPPSVENFSTDIYQFPPHADLNFAARGFYDQRDGQYKPIGALPVDVIRNASLIKINNVSGRITSLDVASMDDRSVPAAPGVATRFSIQAQYFILACGGVGNAHQLLLSNVGTSTGNVGRYFMCHPLSAKGVISIDRPYMTSAESYFMDGRDRNGNQWNSPLGGSITGRFVTDQNVARTRGIGLSWFFPAGGQCYFEMAPNPANQIILNPDPRKVDAVFGLRQPVITLNAHPTDEMTYIENCRLFQAAVAKRGGLMNFNKDWTDVVSQFRVNGHHLGSTRMAALPTDGVVDQDLKVFSTNNLYVSGASVFASGDVANPTMTIIALSIRLAYHLANKMGKGVRTAAEGVEVKTVEEQA